MTVLKNLAKESKKLFHSAIKQIDNIDEQAIKKLAVDFNITIDQAKKEVDDIAKSESLTSKMKDFGFSPEQAENYKKSFMTIDKEMPGDSEMREVVTTKANYRMKEALRRAQEDKKNVGDNIEKIKKGQKGAIRKSAELEAFVADGGSVSVTKNTSNEVFVAKSADEVASKKKAFDALIMTDESEVRKLSDDIVEKGRKKRVTGNKKEHSTTADKRFDVLTVKIGHAWKRAKGNRAKPEARIALKRADKLNNITQPLKLLASDLEKDFRDSVKKLKKLNPNHTEEDLLDKQLEFAVKHIRGSENADLELLKQLDLTQESIIPLKKLLYNRTLVNTISEDIKTGDFTKIKQLASGAGLEIKDFGPPEVRGLFNTEIPKELRGDMKLNLGVAEDNYIRWMLNGDVPFKSANPEDYVSDIRGLNYLKNEIFQEHIKVAGDNIFDRNLRIDVNDIAQHHSLAFKMGRTPKNEVKTGGDFMSFMAGTVNTTIQGLLSLKLGSALGSLFMAPYNFQQMVATGAIRPLYGLTSLNRLGRGTVMGVGNWIKGFTIDFSLYNKKTFNKIMKNNPYIQQNKNLPFDDFIKEKSLPKGETKFKETLKKAIRHDYYTVHNPEILKSATLSHQNLFSIEKDSKTLLGRGYIGLTTRLGSFNAIAVSITDLMAREWAMEYSADLLFGEFKKHSEKMISLNLKGGDRKLNHLGYINTMMHNLKVYQMTEIEQQEIKNMISLSIDENGVVNPKMLISLGSALANGFIDVNLFKYATENRPEVLDMMKDIPVANYMTFFKSWSIYYKRALSKTNPLNLIPKKSDKQANEALNFIQKEAKNKGWDYDTLLTAISQTDTETEVVKILDNLGVNKLFEESGFKKDSSPNKYGVMNKNRINFGYPEGFINSLQKEAQNKYILRETHKNYARLISGVMGTTLAGIGAYYTYTRLNGVDDKDGKFEEKMINYTRKRAPIWGEFETILTLANGTNGIDGNLVLEDGVFLQSAYNYLRNLTGELSEKYIGYDMGTKKNSEWSIYILEKQFWESTEGRATLNWIVRYNIVANKIDGGDRPTGTLKPELEKSLKGEPIGVKLKPTDK